MISRNEEQLLFSDGSDEIVVTYDQIKNNGYDLSMERYMTDQEKENQKIRRLTYDLMKQYPELNSLINEYDRMKTPKP